MSIITKFFAVLCVAGTLSGSAIDPGELSTVSGEGFAPIVDGDYVLARKIAEKEALNGALFTAVQMLLSEIDIEERRDFIEENVFSLGMNFIQSYRYVQDGPELNDEEIEVYHVNIEYSVFMKYLREELSQVGLKITGGQKTKIVIIIEEQTLGGAIGSSSLILPSATEESTGKILSESGFFIFDRKEVRQLSDSSQIIAAMDGDRVAVMWLASQFEADYVLLGTASSKRYPMKGNSPAFAEGIIDAKIYDGSTADILWEDKVVETLLGGDAASGFRSIRLAADKFRVEIKEFLTGPMGF